MSRSIFWEYIILCGRPWRRFLENISLWSHGNPLYLRPFMEGTEKKQKTLPKNY